MQMELIKEDWNLSHRSRSEINGAGMMLSETVDGTATSEELTYKSPKIKYRARENLWRTFSKLTSKLSTLRKSSSRKG